MAECGTEQQGLADGAFRHAAQQEADVLDEAQIEHAIGFVQHADLAGMQRDHLVLLDVVDQAARGGDDHVHALLQQLTLLVVIHATVDQRETQAQVGTELHRILVDLDGQFAGRGKDQRTRILRLAVGQRRAGQQAVHDSDQEGQGLAGAGLGLAGNITAGQRDRQGQRLDRGAAGESGSFKAGLQGRMQLEGGEGQIGQRFVAHESVLVWPPARGAAGTSSSRGTVANCGPCGGLAGWDHRSARRTMPQFTALGQANRNAASHGIQRRHLHPATPDLNGLPGFAGVAHCQPHVQEDSEIRHIPAIEASAIRWVPTGACPCPAIGVHCRP